MATRMTFGVRMTGLTVLGNLGGGVLTFLYFHYVDPAGVDGGIEVGAWELVYFVLAFAVLYVIGRHLSARWLTPLTQGGGAAPLPGPAGDTARRRALLLPAFVALVSGGGWVAAAFIWGVVWPLMFGDFALGRSLRQMFGITFVAGPFVTAIVFFCTERLMRPELPRLFPGGELSAVRVPRLRVRTRMLAVFLLIGLLPLAVLSVAALTRADALRTADAAEAVAIIHNLNVVVVVLALGGLLVSSAWPCSSRRASRNLCATCRRRWLRCGTERSTRAARSCPTTRSVPSPKASTAWSRVCASARRFARPSAST